MIFLSVFEGDKKTLKKFGITKKILNFASALLTPWTFSSAGLEYLSDRQRVDGSNPPTSTKRVFSRVAKWGRL